MNRSAHFPVWICAACLAACSSDDEPDAPAFSFTFASDRSGNFEIYRSDSGVISQLTDDPAFHAWWPRSSPADGTLLFYRSAVATAPPGSGQNDYDHAALWFLDPATGTPELAIGEDANGWSAQGVADWSPDGSQLVMAARQQSDGRWHLFVTDADASNPVKITSRDGLFLDPSWSPDGTRIVYTAFPVGETGTDLAALEIHTSLPDGTDEQRLTFDGFRDNDPYWSYDGAEIAFESAVDPALFGVGQWALRAVAPDGTGLRTILDDGNINTLPRWSTDDAWIYLQRFVFGAPGQFRIARVARDGSQLSYLTPGGDYDDSDIDVSAGIPLVAPAPALQKLLRLDIDPETGEVQQRNGWGLVPSLPN